MINDTLLYIHIPFCDSRCHYCSFNTYVDKLYLKESYMKALMRQLRADLKRFRIEKGQISTLFIGGGTPSTIEPALYEPIFETLEAYLKDNAEITTEANPNSATKAWLEGMRELGVNRVSFGVQSFFDDKLKLLGRAHGSIQAVKAVENAKKAGFGTISLDLIYATMLDTAQRVEKELKSALELPIEHLSAYELSIEEGTPFQRRPEVRVESLEQANIIKELLESVGWEQYEISNFGKKRCGHNLGYWQYKPYLGIGSGAVGRVDSSRYYPHQAVERYIDDPLFKEKEQLSPSQILEERIFLGLRSCVGVAEEILDGIMKERARLLKKEAKLRFSNGRWFNRDYLLSDEVALFIIG
ncbi:MAG: radical SAM family heme chaperone HemW [Hydrogenimonas sp.]|nr:radical SAM family heme chaperone HemW [Hydrogenimonas sp.]